MHAALQAHYGGPKQEPSLFRRAAMSLGGEPLANGLDALQHHGMSALHGIAQLTEHGVNYAANRVLPADSGLRRSINATTASDDAALAQREAAYQARTPNGLPATLGATVGEVAPWMVGVGELRNAGLLPKATTTLGKATALAGDGAAMGAATPVTQGDYGSQKARQVGYGAAGGFVLPYLGKVAGVGTDAVASLTNRFIAPERAADARVLRTLTPDMLPALERGSPVPGVIPTVAEAAPSPGAVKLERKLRNDPVMGLPFANQDVANDAARLGVIRGIGGTDEALANAIDARQSATRPFYNALPGQRVPVQDVLDALDRLKNSSLGVRTTVKGARNELEADIRSHMAPDGTIDADILHGMHQNTGSYLAKHANPLAPVGTQEEAAFVPIKDAIADALDRAVPGYRANSQAYATLSAPINDMEAARRILAEAGYNGLNPGGDPVATLGILKKALKGDDKARYGFSPQARQQMENVLGSLQARSAANNTIAASGSNTLADSLLSNKHMPLVKAGVGATVGGLLGHIGLPGGEAVGGGLGLLATGALNHANDRVALLTAERMANAEKAAAILRAAQKKQQGLLGQLPNYLLPYGAPQIPLLQQTP